MAYDRFSLVLMVTRACNLRCTYCYVGEKGPQRMRPELGRAAIDRAIRSLHRGGTLELGFFGGEPLIEARRIAEWIAHARRRAAEIGAEVQTHLTTNGTVTDPPAGELLAHGDLDVSVSHDGLPEVHDRHRRDTRGRGTSDRVMATLRKLVAEGRDVCVVMVVRPDTVEWLPDGILRLREEGVRHVDPTLDLWATWDRQDAARLEGSLVRAADVWREGLPHCGVGWFDEKAAKLAGVPISETARCGFGDGEIAVAPSGNLYPCERLIGEDGPESPMRLPGHVLDGEDFDAVLSPPERSTPSCSACAIQSQCNTTCRCSNYVRTGDVTQPDGLLCLLDRVCHDETARVLRRLVQIPVESVSLSHISL